MAERRNWLRLTGAFVLAPLLASALTGLATVVLFYEPGEQPLDVTAQLNLAGMIASLAAMIALPTTLSIGLIAHIMFQRRGVTSIWAYILTGAITGALVPAVLTSFLPASSLFALYGTPIGAITALLAWLIRRPDRDARRVS